jgi:hypothetical protein
VFASGVAIGEQADTYNLKDWFAFHRMRCRPMTLLVVSTSAYPASVKGRDDAPFQARAWVPPMPAVVTRGSVKVADLFPGVHLAGPDRVTLDQAFAWQEAGRSALSEIPPSTP